VSLIDMLEQGPLVLYFYPADFTPGCTKEACSIRDMHDDILSVGLRVLGVSPQDATSHMKFKEEHELPFTLLSCARRNNSGSPASRCPDQPAQGIHRESDYPERDSRHVSQRRGTAIR
jgi:peroxiredoxin